MVLAFNDAVSKVHGSVEHEAFQYMIESEAMKDNFLIIHSIPLTSIIMVCTAYIVWHGHNSLLRVS